MDRWSEMQAFVTAVSCQGFSAAARQMGLSPSAVSKQITRLENRLAVRLLNRTTRKISLTEAGRSYYQRCIEIIDELEVIEQGITQFGHEPKGLLKINCSAGFAKHVLLSMLSDFQEQYPKLEVELQLTGQAIDLVQEGVDVAIRFGVLADTSLVARRLGEFPRIICATPDYLQREGEISSPEQLQKHNCLRLSTSELFNQWALSREGNKHLLSVTGNFITDNVEILHDYCLSGAGVARLASFMVEEDIKAGRLVPLLQDYVTDKQVINALYPHRKYLPAKVKVFLDFITPYFTLSR